MPPKPNYKHQRLERDRAKKASKEMKAQERAEQAALRKAGDTGEAKSADDPAEAPGESP